LEKLLDFSKSFSPQFRIDLDIFINDYSQENFKKLEQIKLNLPNNFISLFFIYNSTNKEIYKYNDFLLSSNIYKDNIFTVNYNKDFSFNKSI
jgi:hypothetical protein